MKKVFLQFVLKQMLSKPAPWSIPLTGAERLKSRDYFTVEFFGKDSDGKFLTTSINSNGVEGGWFQSTEYGRYQASIPFTYLDNFSIFITQYYGSLEFRYHSYWSYLYNKVTFLPARYLIGRRLRQWRFNRTNLAREEKYDLLADIYEKTIKDSTYGTSRYEMLSKKYGESWAEHPGHEEILNYNELLLNSLLESGDLKKDGAHFKLAPRALNTLAEFEESNRKHQDATRLQKMLAFLTGCLVVVGFLQIFIK